MSIDFRIDKSGGDEGFTVHANEPITVEVSLDSAGYLLALVYRGEQPGEDDEPVGGYDGNVRNRDWVLDPYDGADGVVVIEDRACPVAGCNLAITDVDGLAPGGVCPVHGHPGTVNP